MMTFLSTHLSLYALVFLRTCLPTYLSPYALNFLPLHLYTSQKNIPFRYLFEIDHLSRHVVSYPRLAHYMARNWSYWLNAIDALFLCDSQPYYQYWSE